MLLLSILSLDSPILTNSKHPFFYLKKMRRLLFRVMKRTFRVPQICQKQMRLFTGSLRVRMCMIRVKAGSRNWKGQRKMV